MSIRPPNLDSKTRAGIAFALGIFLISRITSFVVVWVGAQLFPKSVHKAFLAWDARWWNQLIGHGYPHIAVSGVGDQAQNTIAFFPAYALIARFFRNLGLTSLQAGLFVSIASGAMATMLLWLLARELTDERTANYSIAIFCFFPGSLAMLLPMSEGVMLTMAIGCLIALLRRNWLLAGALAAIASATRPNGAVLALCCLWAAVDAVVRHREWKSLIAPVLAPLGLVAYFVFLWHHTGDFLAWSHVEKAGWKYDSYAPFSSLSALLHPLAYFDNAAAVYAFFVALAGLYFLEKWRPPAVLTVFAVSICLLAFANGGTESKLRYVWTAFPIFIAAARWASNEMRFVSLFSVATMSLPVYILLTLFPLRIIL